jgi:UreD urease accessory protein
MLQALTTQATTKVYKRRSSIESVSTAVHSSCSQTLLCTVASGALLALLPDPVTCFKDASYRQVWLLDNMFAVTPKLTIYACWLVPCEEAHRSSTSEGCLMHCSASCQRMNANANYDGLLPH